MCSQIAACMRQLEQTLKDAESNFPEIKFSVLLFGDFNSTPPFGVLELMRTGQVK
jgi:hypothetical protein